MHSMLASNEMFMYKHTVECDGYLILASSSIMVKFFEEDASVPKAPPCLRPLYWLHSKILLQLNCSGCLLKLRMNNLLLVSCYDASRLLFRL